MPVMCGPRGLPFARNYLFHNDGEGRFTDVSGPSGIGATKALLRLHRRRLRFRQRRLPRPLRGLRLDAEPALPQPANGTFEEIGLLAGVALNEDGQEQGGMGVAVADYDEDGDADIVKTNFSDDVPNLYHNNGDGTFEDRVFAVGPRRVHGLRRVGRRTSSTSTTTGGATCS